MPDITEINQQHLALACLRGKLEPSPVQQPIYECPRFATTIDGEIMVVVHREDKIDNPITAFINLGNAMQLAADIAERAVRAENLGSEREQLAKIKRIRKAMGFTY